MVPLQVEGQPWHPLVTRLGRQRRYRGRCFRWHPWQRWQRTRPLRERRWLLVQELGSAARLVGDQQIFGMLQYCL